MDQIFYYYIIWLLRGLLRGLLFGYILFFYWVGIIPMYFFQVSFLLTLIWVGFSGVRFEVGGGGGG